MLRPRIIGIILILAGAFLALTWGILYQSALTNAIWKTIQDPYNLGGEMSALIGMMQIDAVLIISGLIIVMFGIQMLRN